MKIIAWLLLASLALVSIDTQAQTPQAVKQIEDLTTANYPQWDALYKHLHQNPELSLQEVATTARSGPALLPVDGCALRAVLPRLRAAHGLACIKIPKLESLRNK